MSKIKIILAGIIILFSVAYTLFKTHQSGSDFELYLNASKQLVEGDNMYYGKYYNSPLFALFINLFNILPAPVNRMLWGLMNLGMSISIFFTGFHLMKSNLKLSNNQLYMITVIVLFIMLGSINFNIMLGQITILILWLVIMAINQFIHGKRILACILLALAINFKVFPLLFLFVFVVFKKYKYIGITAIFLCLSTLIPAIIIGFQNNLEVHLNWIQSINPFSSTMVVECYYGSISITGWLPLYLHPCKLVEHYHQSRNINVINLSINETMNVILMLRIIGLSLIFYMAHLARKDTPSFHNVFYILSLISLSVLVFMPHQHKYSELMLLLPVGYFIIIIQKELLFKSPFDFRKLSNYGVISLLLFIGLMGRDIVGDQVTSTIDNYGLIGIVNTILFLLFLLLNPFRKKGEYYPSKVIKG